MDLVVVTDVTQRLVYIRRGALLVHIEIVDKSIGYVNLRDLEVVTGSPQMALGRVNMTNEHGLLTAMNGDVNYGSALLSAEINRLCPKAVEKVVVEQVSIRGNSSFWKLSDLEEALDQMNY